MFIKNSIESPIKYSVSQSIVLGSLLFMIYINGHHNHNIDGEIFCFTYYAAIIFSSNCLNNIETK